MSFLATVVVRSDDADWNATKRLNSFLCAQSGRNNPAFSLKVYNVFSQPAITYKNILYLTLVPVAAEKVFKSF